MKLPKEVKISGMVYKVIPTKEPLIDGNIRAYGHVDFETREITIDVSLRDEQGHMQTLLHEILHAIVYDRDIDLGENEEIIIDQLAKGLYQVLVENKLF